MKDFSRYEIAEVIADMFDLTASEIVSTGEYSNFQKDFEADEFDMMELCARLEDEFDIKIPPEVEQGWATVHDVYKTIESLG